MNRIKFATADGKRVDVLAQQGINPVTGSPLRPTPAQVKREGLRRGWKLIGTRQRRAA